MSLPRQIPHGCEQALLLLLGSLQSTNYGKKNNKLSYITHDFFWENKKYIKIIQSSQQLFNPNEESLEETNSFSKRFRELILVGRILNYGDNKFIIIAMPLDSFYHFHVSDLPFVETTTVK